MQTTAYFKLGDTEICTLEYLSSSITSYLNPKYNWSEWKGRLLGATKSVTVDTQNSWKQDKACSFKWGLCYISNKGWHSRVSN